MSLNQIDADVFELRDKVTQMGVRFPLRATLIRVGTDVLVVSPVPLGEGVADQVEELGRLRWIVAPSLFHHLSAGAWKEKWPDAELLAPKGLAKKRKDLTIDHFLEDGAPATWEGVIELLPIRGAPTIDEFALLHLPSRSLVVTDLCFHLHEFDGLMAKLFFGAFRLKKGEVSQSRLWRMVTKDRAAAASSVGNLLGCDFDRLIMAHGELVDEGGKEALEASMDWMLQRA